MRRVILALLTIAVCWFASYAAHAAEFNLPKQVTAGKEFSVTTSGSGDGVLVLIGPRAISQHKVRLGDAISISDEDVRAAGRYIAVLRAGGESSSKTFFVAAGKPGKLTFLARPSRVPAGKQDVISGVGFVFDQYDNLVLAPSEVRFDLSVGGKQSASRAVTTKSGIAWTRMNSGSTQGAAQFVASLPGAEDEEASVRRVVQQVAAEACNLRMRAQRTERAIVVVTEPVKGCSGNSLPDGTIVTFTEVDAAGRSTVDARIKRDIARAELPLSDNAAISVASGVVLGNELHMGSGK